MRLTLAVALLCSLAARAAPVPTPPTSPKRAPAAAVAPTPTPAMPPAAARPAPASTHGLPATRCSACHTTTGWTKVSFDHSKTGFPLEGRHTEVLCRDCHLADDFKAPVATSCAGCHTDVHAGELGTRCASCHDSRTWQSRFDADAHRRTNFPLSGRHAAIACEECHLDLRNRSFIRATVACVNCHDADYKRAALVSIDHAAAGFGTDCRSCHSGVTFRGARFTQHDACFQLAPGPHSGIACLQCHTSLPRPVQITGACASETAKCTRCHTCPSVQNVHANVQLFQCTDLKCYQCHQFVQQSLRPARPPKLRGG